MLLKISHKSRFVILKKKILQLFLCETIIQHHHEEIVIVHHV